MLGLHREDSFGDRLRAIESAFGVKTRKLAENIELHSGRRPLLYLCLLANTIDAALQPLRSYAEFCGQTVCVVRSAYEIAEAMAVNTHIVVDITSGLSWLPSKVLLDAKWGDSLLVSEDGAVVGGASSVSSRLKSGHCEATTYRERVVPEECYLHFYCDRPLNPPAYFAERVAGRVVDLRSAG